MKSRPTSGSGSATCRTLYTKTSMIIRGKSRLAGLTLKASDTDYTVGPGPVIEGPAIALLLAAAGRRSALDELSGKGVPILQQRS
jgi:hypothetical protein